MPIRNLILHIPHSSKNIPIEERPTLVLDAEGLNAELLRMTDAFTDQLFPPTAAEAARIVYPFSRLVCDVERFQDDDIEPMAALGMGAIYTKTSEGRPLRSDMSAQMRAQLLAQYYHPHHAKLSMLVERVLSRQDFCVVIDCHSFSSSPLPHEYDQSPNRPDICLGTDEFHTPKEMRDAAIDVVKASGLSVAVNSPFSGALVPSIYYNKSRRVLALMIEVNRRLYMDEIVGNESARFYEIKHALRTIIGAVSSSVTE